MNRTETHALAIDFLNELGEEALVAKMAYARVALRARFNGEAVPPEPPCAARDWFKAHGMDASLARAKRASEGKGPDAYILAMAHESICFRERMAEELTAAAMVALPDPNTRTIVALRDIFRGAKPNVSRTQ